MTFYKIGMHSLTAILLAFSLCSNITQNGHKSEVTRQSQFYFIKKNYYFRNVHDILSSECLIAVPIFREDFFFFGKIKPPYMMTVYF